MDKQEIIRLQAAEQENLILKQKVEDLEKLQAANKGIIGDRLTSEMEKIRLKGKSGANKIVITESADYKGVTLWTMWGKQIGPMHPDNAVQTLQRFAKLGILVTVDKPTPAEFSTWGNSPEGKAFYKKETEKRVIKEKSRRGNQIEKYVAEIAKLSGTTVEAIHAIKQAAEVGKK
jgi:hypothetical protein